MTVLRIFPDVRGTGKRRRISRITTPQYKIKSTIFPPVPLPRKDRTAGQVTAILRSVPTGRFSTTTISNLRQRYEESNRMGQHIGVQVDAPRCMFFLFAPLLHF